MLFVKLLVLMVGMICLYSSGNGNEFAVLKNEEDKWPTIGISILVRNKAHSLPFALSAIEVLDYPKDRLYVWFYIDNSVDKSQKIIEEWSIKHRHEYNEIYINGDMDMAETSSNRNVSVKWTKDRLVHLIKLREKALQFARKRWADFSFMLDADVVLTEPSTLKRLVEKNQVAVAPMLVTDGHYSNFWAGMSDNYYYQSAERYDTILKREETGCFEVPMIHSAVLVDLRARPSDRLTYVPSKIPGYTGPVDDIIAFAISARVAEVPLVVCNDLQYGYLPVPVDMNDTKQQTDEAELFLNLKMEAIANGSPLPLVAELKDFVQYPRRDTLGVDRVFWINLERRTKRRQLMEASFQELGVEAVLVEAVDGSKLDMEHLAKIGVTLLPKYRDPYHDRPMKSGEVGCFLSHFKIWKEIAARHIPCSLVLEDDIRFVPNFRHEFGELLHEVRARGDWDLVYIGRKIMATEGEERVSPRLVVPRYTYWSLGYLVSERGARKLIRAEPTAKMLPVDEFLPIMFDQHPNETWKAFFPVRDLVAFSASPLLVSPTHYTGEPGYVSDTEASKVLRASPDGGKANAKTL